MLHPLVKRFRWEGAGEQAPFRRAGRRGPVRACMFRQANGHQRGFALTRLNDLAREYEARHYPPTRRLDLQAEGPEGARERAMRWIQSFAHVEPGADLLLVVERVRPGRGKGPVRIAVERLLEDLNGGLIEWWQPFADGSLALRVARDPRRFPGGPAKPKTPPGEGRSPETAGATYLDPTADIPPDLLPIATRAAELRRSREGL